MLEAEQVLFRYAGDATTDDATTVIFTRLDRKAELIVRVQPLSCDRPNGLRLTGFPNGASICLLVERQMTRANHHRPIGCQIDLPVPNHFHDGPLPLAALVILVHPA